MTTSRLHPTDIKVGMMIIPVANTNSHSYRLGRRYKIVSVNADRYGFVAQCLQTGQYGNTLVPSDCTSACVSKAIMQGEIDILEEQIAERNAEIKFISQRIRWMNDTGVSEFNEDEYQIYSVIENTMGKDMIVSANKMAEMVSRLRSNREGFLVGDTVGIGKRRFWVVGINTLTDTLILSEGIGHSHTIMHKSHILDSIKKVLTEKVQPFLKVNSNINLNGVLVGQYQPNEPGIVIRGGQANYAGGAFIGGGYATVTGGGR